MQEGAGRENPKLLPYPLMPLSVLLDSSHDFVLGECGRLWCLTGIVGSDEVLLCGLLPAVLNESDEIVELLSSKEPFDTPSIEDRYCDGAVELDCGGIAMWYDLIDEDG